MIPQPVASDPSSDSSAAWRYWVVGGSFMLAAAVAELAMGRKPWGVGGEPGLWSGQVLSPHNSQYLADPYTFTHLSHGIFIYAILRLVAGGRSLAERGVIAVGFEAGWEVLENTDFVIRRYRTATLALNYFGDSVMNSMVDIMACMTGFWIASRLPTRGTVVVVIVLEAGLAWWIHDGLLLNIVMLIHPIAAIRAWQNGVT